MRLIKLFGLVGLVMLAASLPTGAQNWRIVPGNSVGAIGRNTSEKDLIRIFGRQNVKRANIDVGEGETLPGTIVYPNDPRKRLSIVWHDPATRAQPETITIRGKNTFWKTDRGITIGTSLKTIEMLNGGPFSMSGFGWDYSGTVMHSNRGKMRELGVQKGEEITGRTLLLRLEPAAALRRTKDYETALGDGNFFSDHPAMQRLNPRVYEMIIDFSL